MATGTKTVLPPAVKGAARAIRHEMVTLNGDSSEFEAGRRAGLADALGLLMTAVVEDGAE